MKSVLTVSIWVVFLSALATNAASQDMFEPAVDYAAGNGPYSVCAADLDGDGDDDLAVANFDSDNVSILKNNGDGAFASAVNYGAGASPRSVYAADLDGDGDNDLTVANFDSDNVSILKNNGDGTFASAVNYGAGNWPFSVYAADLDGDGDYDLAVANWNSDNVSILKNNGDGAFASAVNYGTGNWPFSVCAADLDGDGDDDLAVANFGTDNVSILKNNGDGTFFSAVNYGVGGYPSSVYAADLDGDGDNDLAVANAHSDNVSILRNVGGGTFASAVNYGAGSCPYSVYAADLDGDGDDDLAVANANSDNVSILKNNGDGTFASALNYGAGGKPNSVYAVDLDGDGDDDLAVANLLSNNVSILINLSNNAFGYVAGTVVSSTTGDPIDGANIMLMPQTSYSTKTDAQGNYELMVPAGVHDLSVWANGYEPGGATGIEVLIGQYTTQDISLSPLPPQLELRSVQIQDSDDCLSPGDHATLILGFFNEGGAASNVDVYLTFLSAFDRVGLRFYNTNSQQWLDDVSLTLSVVGAHEWSFREVEIYTTLVDPDLVPDGNVLPDDPQLAVISTGYPDLDTTEALPLCQVKFPQLSLSSQSISATLLEEDCIRHPEHLSIRRYAQYAVGNPNCEDNSKDPDDRESAIAQINGRVSSDYEYGGWIGLLRQMDIDMVTRLGDTIGICYNFMDLSTGLLRSVGLQTRDVWGKFTGGTSHAWNEILVDEAGSQDSWMHFDGRGVIGDKLYYAQSPVGSGWGEPVAVFADTVPMSNASSSWWFHDSEVVGVRACNPNRSVNHSCVICWMSMFPEFLTEECAVDVRSEYAFTGVPPSIDLESAQTAYDASVALIMDAPVSVEKDGAFQLTGTIENVGESSVYEIVLGVGLKPWAADSLNTYFADGPVVQLDSLPAGSTDSVVWTITPLRTGSAIPLSVYVYDSSQTFWVGTGLLQNINEPGTLPDLVVTGSVSPSLAEPGESVDLTALVLNDSLQDNPDAIVAAYITSETNPGFDDTVSLQYSEPDSAYTGNLTLPSSAPVGEYSCRFIGEESGFDSDSIETRFSVSAILSVDVVTDSPVYDCRDTVSISAEIDDRGDTITDAAVNCEVITSLGSRLLPMEVDSGTVYGLSFVPADFVPYMMDATTLPAGDWTVIVSTDYFDSYAEDSFDVTINAPDQSISSPDISYTSSRLQEGYRVFINARVRNAGTALSDSTVVSFFLDGISSMGQIGADYVIPPLPAGDSSAISVMWNATAAVNETAVYVVIDQDSLSIDSDRTNNTASVLITLLVCGDIDGNGTPEPDIADLVYLVTYMFQDGPEPPVMAACDIDGNGTLVPDIADLVYLVTYMFQNGPPLRCP